MSQAAIQCTLSDLAALTGGVLLGEDRTFAAVSTDTRTLAAGDLYFALSGERFDGHAFCTEALAAGAVGLVVEREIAGATSQVVVTDVREAFGGLGAWWRRTWGGPLVAITGSNGKTTVKEMTAAILAEAGSLLYTRGNLNNDIGVPLTLLRLQDQARAVVEMGANHPGEIHALSRMASPDVAIVTNAGRAHLEGFGSPEGVLRAKAEILDGLKPDGTFVYNADDRWGTAWRRLAEGGRSRGQRVLAYGVANKADVHSPPTSMHTHWSDQGFSTRFQVTTPAGSFEAEIALVGEHNRLNALAAIAAAHALGIPVDAMRRGLARVRPVKGRLQAVAGARGETLIDDSYNANPDSVAAAIAVLASAPRVVDERQSGRRILVLGELAELGAKASGFYVELGQKAREAGIDRLYAVGPAGLAVRTFGIGGRRFEVLESMIDHLRTDAHPGDRVLIKGSRRAGLERVVEALAAPADEQGGAPGAP